jgi:threonine aldolase
MPLVPPMPLTPQQRRELRSRCSLIVPGFAAPRPADTWRRMADWFEVSGLDHDLYGEGELVQGFERKIARLLGKAAAVFMPSGVMAQLAAVRVWTETSGLERFGMHPTSHLILHEQEAYAALWRSHGVVLGDALRPLLASDLQASPQPLACVIVELPIREAGGQLPRWDDLQALKDTARERGIRLHMDGARLWESAPHYGRSHADIAEGFDSVYVSVYKGIGALSGALLAGDEDFVAQARLWRRRMGGTLYHLSPMVASAAMQFDERLALMPALHRRAQGLAAMLSGLPGLRVNPAEPQAPLFHLFIDADVERTAQGRDRWAEQHGQWLFDGVRAAAVPGWCVSELTVGDRLLQLDDAQLQPIFADFCKGLRAG